MARTKRAPWDYEYAQPSTASILAEAAKMEALWDESLAKELPKFDAVMVAIMQSSEEHLAIRLQALEIASAVMKVELGIRPEG